MKENYQNLPWHKREIIAHQYPLTDAEKLKLAETMANARAEASRLEEELSGLKKAYKEQIDMYTGEFSEAAKRFKSGLAEAVEVECDVYQDFDHEEMVYVARDATEELLRRPMNENEKRPDFFRMLNESESNVINFNKYREGGQCP